MNQLKNGFQKKEHYDKYISKYLNIFNNNKLNKKFETEINNKNN